MKINNKHDQRVKKGGDNKGEKNKKPFNKKKYREQKYSLKHKVKQYEDRRNKAIKRSFYKTEKNAVPNSSENSEERQSNKKQGYSLNDQWKFKAEKKQKEKEEKTKAMKEREEAIKKYQRKRIEMNKKMTRKNKWGQPALGSRMEVLHERLMDKIKNNVL